MKGKWLGKYWYSENAPAVLQNKETEFELIIETHINSTILGKVSDNVEMGGTRGIGTISGIIKGNQINFVKRMPISSVVLPDGTKIEENKPHRPIYYSGTIDAETNSIKGTWKFRPGIGFMQRRWAIFPGIKGHWEMKKVLE